MIVKEKRSYSVPEVQRLLGIGKTSAYALAKSGFFETIIVRGKIRVVRKSFEDWLCNQNKYRLKNKEEYTWLR